MRVEGNIYRSAAAEVLLENPAQLYAVEFCSIETSERWQIPGIGRDNFCMLFNRQGELVEDGQLPEGGAYIIVPFNSSVEPAAIIQERLPGRWADYAYCYIDLKNVDVVSVKAGQDVVVFKRLAQLQPTFISRNFLPGIKAGEAPICQGQLPNLLFSITLPAEVAFYGVQLASAEGVEFRSLEQHTGQHARQLSEQPTEQLTEQQTRQLTEQPTRQLTEQPTEQLTDKLTRQLTPAISKDNVVHIPLADLSTAKYGLFTVTLVKRGRPVWSAPCAVVPDLELAFDQQFYRIQDETKEKGQLEFISKHEIEFYPAESNDEEKNNEEKNYEESNNGESNNEESNKTGLKRLSPTRVEFDTSLNSIGGKLIYRLAGKTLRLDVCIEVPGIRWRQPGGEWRARVEEIWHEDLGEIEIKVPEKAGYSIKVSLPGEAQVIAQSIQKGAAVFGLRRFSDTLRDSGRAVQELVLTFPPMPPFLLARVRMRWQALKVNLTQQLQGSERQLLVEWEDRGKAADRVVRFWPLEMPDAGVLEWEIPDGASRIDLEVPLASMPPGRYRLNLAVTDLWDNDRAEMPEEGSENCKDVHIGTADEQLEAYVGKQLEITGFYCQGELVKPETFYWVEVRALEPRFAGEVLLTGNVYSVQPKAARWRCPIIP